MRFTTVCHAHGGRAPQVRYRAERREAEALLLKFSVGLQQDLLARRAAVEPWRDELGPPSLWRYMPPDQLRRIATEMARVAKALRDEAAGLERRR